MGARVSSPVFVQMIGFGFSLHAAAHSRRSYSIPWALRWSERWNRSRATAAKRRSTWLIHDEQFGVNCMWNREW